MCAGQIPIHVKKKKLRLGSFAVFDVKRMGARPGIYLSLYYVWSPAFHKGDVVRHAYNPSTQKVEVGVLMSQSIQSQPGIQEIPSQDSSPWSFKAGSSYDIYTILALRLRLDQLRAPRAQALLFIFLPKRLALPVCPFETVDGGYT